MTRGSMIGTITAAVLGVLSFAPSSSAWAAEPVIVAPAVTEGELNDAVTDRLETRLHEVVRKSDLALIAVADEVGQQAAACEDDPCREQLIVANNARFLLIPEIRLADEDYHLRLTLYGPNGAQAARLEESCGLCGLAEVADVMGDLGARIGRKVEVATRASSLEIRSVPAGAKVFLGDELVGMTPVELPLDAGAHQLRVELDGHIGLERSVELVAGEAKSLDLALQPIPKPERSKLFTSLGWTALAVGIGAAAGGATLIALDERPITSDCSGANIDANGTCRWRYSTLGGGIGLAAGGAALIGTGIALLVVGRKRSASPTSARVRLRPSLGGLGLAF